MARKTRTRTRGRLGLILGAALVALALGAAARADNISNNLDSTVDAAAEVMPLQVGGANGTTRLYVDPTNGDGKNGCNLTGGTTASISLASSDTSVATVSPSSVTFTSCVNSANGPIVTVTPVAAGSATISATLTGNTTGATINVAPVGFTVNVAPPPNTPPQISVGGVIGGASYNKGSVPSATCNVTDSEDGNSSFPATLSSITGPYTSDGIGSQTASCSYTDDGGLTAGASLTYSIVDPSAPGIGYVLNPANPDGSNGWYRSDVSLTWTVTEPQSPNSLVKTGCVDQNVTEDQASTAYACSAKSAGGEAGPVSVSVKRDATKPTISGTASPLANLNGWNNTSVSVSFSCGDNLSGVASCGPNAILSAEGAGQSAGGDAVDNAGNTAGTSVGPINIDKSLPSVVYTSAAPDPNGAGWHNTDVVATFTATDSLSGFAGPSATKTGTATTSGEGAAITVGSPAFTDLADNTAAAGAATSAAFRIDKTPPTITKVSLKTADGVDYTPGTWTNQSVTATFSCGDQPGLSGAKDAVVTKVVSASGADQTASAFCEDNAGNTSGASTYSNIDIDKQAPSIAKVSLKKADASDYTPGTWTNQSVTATFACADQSGLSGPKSPSVSDELSGSGADQVASGFCEDNAGNKSDTESYSDIDIDKQPPSIAKVSLKKADASEYTPGTWTNQSVTATFSCSDQVGLSGPKNASVTDTLDGSGANQTASGQCDDNAGNKSPSESYSDIDIDKADPTIVASAKKADDSAYTGGWTNQTVTVSFTCDDELSGIAPGDCPADVVIDGDTGAAGTNVSRTVSDRAGNSKTSNTINVQVDKTDPTIVASAKKADGGAYTGGWTNQTVTVSFTCSDVLSGIAACPADVVVGSDTPVGGENVSRSVSDRAGNTKTSNAITVKVDKTRPNLGISDGNAASASLCGVAMPQKPSFAPSDDLSGLNSALNHETWVTPPTASGVGTYKYNASATDNAGNTAYYPGSTASDYKVYTVVYGTASIAAAPFLQPINADGTSRFKLGSTVPVKFRATCNGVPVDNVEARMYVAKGDNVPDPGVDEAISTAAATTGNLFRWTGTPDNQYIFNLSTKLGYTNPGSSTPTSFTAGTWTLKIGLDDGTWRSVSVQIVK